MGPSIRFGGIRTLLVAVIVLELASLQFGLAQATKPAMAPQSSAVYFPTFGLEFVPPRAAKIRAPDTAEQIVLYQLSEGNNAGAAILIEIVPANGKTLDEASKSLATILETTSAPVDFTIDTEKAVKFSQKVHVESFTNRTTYLVVHNGWQYFFNGLDTAGASAIVPMEALLRTVKFHPAQPALKHLAQFFEQPVDVLGLISINGPRTIRPVKSDEKSITMSIYDYSTKDMENPFCLEFERIQTPAPKTFVEIRDAFSTTLKDKFKTSSSFVWQVNKSVPGLYVSQAMKFDTSKPGEPATTSVGRLCMLELAPGDFLQILFMLSSDVPDADVKSYTDLSDRMIATIKLLRQPVAKKSNVAIPSLSALFSMANGSLSGPSSTWNDHQLSIANAVLTQKALDHLGRFHVTVDGTDRTPDGRYAGITRISTRSTNVGGTKSVLWCYFDDDQLAAWTKLKHGDVIWIQGTITQAELNKIDNVAVIFNVDLMHCEISKENP